MSVPTEDRPRTGESESVRMRLREEVAMTGIHGIARRIARLRDVRLERAVEVA